MKLGHRLPEAAWQVFSMLTSGAELFPQTPVWLGLVVKKFIRTSDWLLESMAGDSERLGHWPSTIPPSPSAQTKQICLIKLSWKKIKNFTSQCNQSSYTETYIGFPPHNSTRMRSPRLLPWISLMWRLPGAGSGWSCPWAKASCHRSLAFLPLGTNTS